MIGILFINNNLKILHMKNISNNGSVDSAQNFHLRSMPYSNWYYAEWYYSNDNTLYFVNC